MDAQRGKGQGGPAAHPGTSQCLALFWSTFPVLFSSLWVSRYLCFIWSNHLHPTKEDSKEIVKKSRSRDNYCMKKKHPKRVEDTKNHYEHQKIQDNIRSYDIWWHPKPLQTDLMMERQRDKRTSGARQILTLHIRAVRGLHPLPFADRICRVVFGGPPIASSKIDTTYLGMNYRRKKRGEIYLTP